VPIGSAINSALVTYVLSLAATYVLALIIDALAPTFNGQKSQIQALKVAAYSSTASWVAGIFHLIPGLRLLTILGLYSLYLLYLGLPVVMKAPREKAMAYTAVVILAAIVLFMIVGVIAGRFMAVPTAGMTVP
jgi:Yip1 domain